MPISGMTTGGQRFPFDQFRQSQTRGARYRPLSGIISGLSLSDSTLTLAVNGSTVQVAVSAGRGKLDAQDVTLASGGAATISLAKVKLQNGLNVIPVYLNPTRLVPTTTTPPAPNDPGNEGSRVLHVADLPDGQVLIDIYEKINGQWQAIHPAHGKIGPQTNPAYHIMSSYKRGFLEPTDGNMAMPLNEVLPTLSLTTNFATELEKFVYFATQVPTQLPQPAKAILRQPAGFLLGELHLDILKLPLSVEVSSVTSGSSSSTLTGDFSQLLKAGSAATGNTGFRVNGMGLNNATISSIAANGQSITVNGTATGSSGTVQILAPSSVGNEGYYLSVISGANKVVDLSTQAALLI